MAFLSKVFGRKDKKQDEKPSASNSSSEASASPLEGKFEYVIPSPSPVGKGPDYPHLSLNLPERNGREESRALSNVFGNDDSVVGKTRLSPEQALVIVRACSQAIIARGLETLGIFHPHWHSASPATQQRLILLFVQSSATVFESEISSTRSPHDVAAVLRWAFRHLKLDSASFGNNPTWYRDFFEAEKSGSYPPKSFSEILAPQLPPVNWQLLNATVELFSAVAAHAEANGVSGSKLSKLLGLWLLAPERSTSDHHDFLSFYDQWERQGRILEHLFLSYIRNEVANHPMPKRLVELVKHYPYANHSQPSPEHDLLPRPRFSTRRYDALFVHIETEAPPSGAKPSKISLQMVADAIHASNPSASDSIPYSVWRKIQETGSAVSSDELLYSATAKYPGLGRILSDDTLGTLSLLADEDIQAESSIVFISDDRKMNNDRYGTRKANRSTSNHARQLSASSTNTVTAQASQNQLGLDWTSFSTSGFLETSPLTTPLAETLLDSKDTEVTSPSVTPSRKGSRKSAKSPSRRSLDVLPPISIPPFAIIGSQLQKSASTSNVASKTNSRVTKAELIKIDEGFIDFWNDSLLDPITDVETWPDSSVVPELESGERAQAKKVEWMVVEQEYIKPTPQSPPSLPVSPTVQSATSPTTVESTSQSPSKRASSPRPSLSSSVNTSMKRFSFWSSSKKDKGESSPTKKKKGKDVKVGEMGEILTEEPKSASPPKKSVEVPAVVLEEQEDREVAVGTKDKARDESMSAGIALVATGVVATGVAAVIAEAAEKTQEEGVATKEVEKKAIPAAQPVLIQFSFVVEEPTSLSPAAVPENTPVLPSSEEKPEPTPEVEESSGEPAAEESRDVPAVQPTEVAEPPSFVSEDTSTPLSNGALLQQPAPVVEENESRDIPVVEESTEVSQPAAVEEPVEVIEQLSSDEPAEAIAAQQTEESAPVTEREAEEQVVSNIPVPEEVAHPVEPKADTEIIPESVEELPETDIAPTAEPLEPLEEVEREPTSNEDALEPSHEEATAVVDVTDEVAPSAPTVDEGMDTEVPQDVPEAEVADVSEGHFAPPEDVENVVSEHPTETSTIDNQVAVAEEEETAAQNGVEEVTSDEQIIEPSSEPVSIEKPAISDEIVPVPGEIEQSDAVDPTSVEEPSDSHSLESDMQAVEAEKEADERIEDQSNGVTVDEESPVLASAEVESAVEPEIPEEDVDEPAVEERETTEAEAVEHEANGALEMEEAPVVDSEPIDSLVHAEPLREPSPGPENDAFSLPEVPIVDAPIIAPPPESLVHAEPFLESSSDPDNDAPSLPEAIPENNEDNLPPAPESLVLSGETPGPHLALSSSEAVTAALVASPDEPTESSTHSKDKDIVEEETQAAEEEDDVAEAPIENGSRPTLEHDEVESKAESELTEPVESEPTEA
ncbi:hypothetical protein BT96DRAFT_913603 [Gymnopus androsaceus JB14]|uniref:Rho-GAP domain-containing protein n=1 Tax=Gymnopus androsaceus JB14 TaxID=1447944 RepID=A0A6A4I9V6_9AGAR|nr:hypothetical protein BT96DRAFT_913603 [Gymnopus androsaceus JB14]